MTSRSLSGFRIPSLETVTESLALSSMLALVFSLVAGVFLFDFNQTRYRLILLAASFAVVACSGMPDLKRRVERSGGAAAAAGSVFALYPL